MRTQNTRKRTGPAARGAFTLLEVMVVLLVIGLLTALTAGTLVRVMDSQKKSNTQVTLNKIQSQLTKQWSAYKDLFWRENPASVSGGSAAWNTAQTLAGNDPKRARVIWVKLRMKQAFPQTFSEALNPAPLPALPTYQQALTALGITGSSAATAPFESSACLLLALQQSVSGGGAKLEDLGVSGSIKAFDLGGGKTINAFADQWNMPLQFCRWPTLNAIPLGNSVAGNVVPSAANDPGDPEGTLAVQSWQAAHGAQFVPPSGICHFLPASTGAAPRSNVVVPLVASCGPDGAKAGLLNYQLSLGLNPTDFSSTGTGAENDNLYSRP